MYIDPEKYIPALQVRIDNWYRKNKWRKEAYAKLLSFNERLDIIRHDLWNYGANVQKPMLALNRTLLTVEGQQRGKRFIRSAQSRTRFFGENHVNG